MNQAEAEITDEQLVAASVARLNAADTYEAMQAVMQSIANNERLKALSDDLKIKIRVAYRTARFGFLSQESSPGVFTSPGYAGYHEEGHSSKNPRPKFGEKKDKPVVSVPPEELTKRLLTRLELAGSKEELNVVIGQIVKDESAIRLPEECKNRLRETMKRLCEAMNRGN